MLIEYVGEDDARVGFKKGQRVEVDDGAVFPGDFRKVESDPPGDPIPNPDNNQEGE